jgi:sugar phosphate permease
MTDANEPLPYASAPVEQPPVIYPDMGPYPRGFRPRRGLNWGYLGLLYTSFYLCRFNLSVANKAISDQYHFSYSEMSRIIFTSTLVYAFGQIINGLITDRIGGKKAMLIGAAGTIIMNVLFGAASVWGILGLFIAIRGIDGYFQSFGAPGMTKIKTAWFAKTERGGFAGIFGFMINLGRLGIFNFGPALLAGFTLFGMVHVGPLHWKWLFWGPSIVCGVVAVAMAFGAKETPEQNGFMPVEAYTPAKPTRATIIRSVIIGTGVALVFGSIFWAYHHQIPVATLTAALNKNDKITAIQISPLREPLVAGKTINMVTTNNSMSVTLSSAAAAGDTTLKVQPLDANSNYTVGETATISKLDAMEMGVLLVAAIIMIFIVLHLMAGAFKPDYAAIKAANAEVSAATRADFSTALKLIVVNPAVWLVAAAYACTGAVRNPIDSWFPRYMQEFHHTAQSSSLFQTLAFCIPIAGSAGSLLSGYISDKLFHGARSPVAAGLYLIEIAIVGFASFFATTPEMGVFFLVALSFTANATHSILGTAAAMDIGGRKMTGFASGVIDSFQYFGASIGLWALGHLLDQYGWKAYFPYMIPFGIIGFCLMVFGRGVISRNSRR